MTARGNQLLGAGSMTTGGSKMGSATQVQRLALESRRHKVSTEERRNEVRTGLYLVSLVIAGSGERGLSSAYN